MVRAPECTNGCITAKGHPRRHFENTCPVVMKKKIAEMDFTCICLRLVKLTTAEFAALQPEEPPLQITGSTAISDRRNGSPEIPSPSPVSGTTPTPRAPRGRPLGSPIKQSRGPMVSQLLSDQPIGPALDPLLLQMRPRPMSIAESSNATSPTREEWEDDKDKEEPQQNTKDMKGALIKSQSQDREESEVCEGKKRLRSEELVYQSDKRRREMYYRNSSARLRENVRKIGIVTGCYGILYLSRHVLLSSLD